MFLLAGCPKKSEVADDTNQSAVEVLKRKASPKQHIRELRGQLDAALAAKDRHSAREIARRVVEVDPTDEQAWRVAIEGYLAVAEFGIADTLIGSWREAVGRESPDMLRLSGDVAKGKGQDDLAVEFWKSAAEKYVGPAKVPALERLIDMGAGKEEWGKALGWVHEWLKVSETEKAQEQRGKIALRARAWADAIEAVRWVEKNYPGNEGLAKNLPLIERVEAHRAKLEALDNALKLAPNNPQVFVDRAFAENELGLYENALEDATSALRLDPQHLPALRQQVHALNKLNRQQEALKIVSAACDGPGAKDALLWFYRGMLEQQGWSSLAAEWALSRSLELQESWAALEWRSAALSRLGREREAIRDAVRAEQLKGAR
jgi:tetratricopeptide (TPR) repeat protein